ncbi:hypothetical protein CVS40_11801 [Lucilia cuprina]|nr:hypothetical protein CVS40_11801 [Lucilia cuprina]
MVRKCHKCLFAPDQILTPNNTVHLSLVRIPLSNIHILSEISTPMWISYQEIVPSTPLFIFHQQHITKRNDSLSSKFPFFPIITVNMSLDHFIRLAGSIIEFEADYNEKRYPINSIHALAIHKDKLKSTWNQIKSAYDKFLFDKENEEESDNDESENLEAFKENQASDSNQFHRFNLPPCEIDVFHDLFTAMYIKNSILSPVEKLFHLIQKTYEEARQIVQISPLTNQGFDLAWSNLKYQSLKILFNLPCISLESAQSIQNLQRDINACISILKLHNIDTDSWDPIFVFLCSNKLPDSTLTLWEQGLKDKSSIPKWSDFDEFLTNRYRTLESVSEIRSTLSMPSASKSKALNISSNVSNSSYRTSSPKCQLCPKEFYPIRKCSTFLQMDYSQRIDEIKKLSLCINCFSKTHSVRNCSYPTNCFRCNKRHNTLLHRDSETFTDPSAPGTSSNLDPNVEPYVTHSHSITIQSTSLNQTVSASAHSQCSFVLSSVSNPSTQLSITALVVQQLSGNLPSETLDHSLFSKLPSIQLAYPQFYKSSEIDILIGADFFQSVMLHGVIQKVCDSLMAQQTIFGWILTGPVSNFNIAPCSIISNFYRVSFSQETSNNKEITNFQKSSNNRTNILRNTLKTFILKSTFCKYAIVLKTDTKILVDPTYNKIHSSLFQTCPNVIIHNYDIFKVTSYLAIRTLFQLANYRDATYPRVHLIHSSFLYTDGHSIPKVTISNIRLIIAEFSMTKWDEILFIQLQHFAHGGFLNGDENSNPKEILVFWKKATSLLAFLSDNPKRINWDLYPRAKYLLQWPYSRSNCRTYEIRKSLVHTPNAKILFLGFCYALEKAYAAALNVRIALTLRFPVT